MKNFNEENNEMAEQQNTSIEKESDHEFDLNLDTVRSEIAYWAKFPNKFLFNQIVQAFRSVETILLEQNSSSGNKVSSSERFHLVSSLIRPEMLIFHNSIFGEIIAGLKNHDSDMLAGIEHGLFDIKRTELTGSEYNSGRFFGMTLKALSRSILTDKAKSLNQMAWFDKTYERLFEDAKKSKENLKALYTETLMLSEPATLWKEKAQSHEKSGKRFLEATIGAFIIALVVLSFIILNVSKVYTSLDSLLTLKLTILITVLISFIGYGLHMLVKLTLSNFHLKTEAEHREQLTKLYLSLLQNENISDIDRQIVFHSLFSKIDTGLIKSDNAPTTINPMSLFKSNQ